MSSITESDAARSLKPYPNYKDSGVEWLGQAPAHWELRKLRHVLRRNTERNQPDLPLLSVVRERGVIRRDTTSIDENHNFIPDDLSNYKVVRAGQFAMNKMKAWQGSYGVSPYDGIVSPAYFVFDVSGLDIEFFHTTIRSRVYVPTFAQASDGVRIGQWDLAETRMREIPILVPPFPEQAAIVRFLDHADRRIRQYIRAKQKLIALLEEQKQAIIHQAVRGQIDVCIGRPYPAYKPAGLEWMEEVQENWGKPTRIKYVSSLNGRLGWQGLKAGEYTSNGPYIVSSAHFRNHKIDWEICPHVTRHRYDMDENIQLAPGDILLMKDGAAMGKLAFVDELPDAACLNSHLLMFRPFRDGSRETYFPRFMFYYMRAKCFQEYVQVNGTGATFLGISQESIGNHEVCLPRYARQCAIVEYLDGATAKIDTAIAGGLREIELLAEYRGRLLADVFTGKLDVREAASGLPEVDPLAAEDNPDDGSNPKVWSDGDELGVTDQTAEA